MTWWMVVIAPELPGAFFTRIESVLVKKVCRIFHYLLTIQSIVHVNFYGIQIVNYC